MPAATKPIQTSAPQVKKLLAKVGRFLFMSEHYDKLDAFVLLVDQINDKLDHRVKMDLTLSDLNAFLSREGMTEEPDLKGCLGKIIHFVHIQRERLGQYAGAQADGKKQKNTDRILDHLLKLWGMDDQRVEDCFAIEVYSSPGSTGLKRSHVSSAEIEAKQQCGEDRRVAGRKRDRTVETPDALVEQAGLSSEQQQGRVLELQDASVETMAKNQRSEDQLCEALMIVPHRARLIEDLRRLVPASILAIEDEVTEDTLADRRSIAQAEVERILKADSEGTAILPGDTAEKRREAFRNIVRLLHPDVGLVSSDDARAMKALDIALRSFMKSELLAED